MSEETNQVEAAVVDESDGTVYVFRGDDQAHVDQLIERWSDNGERTWVARGPARSTAATGFTLDDVRDSAES